MAQVEKLLVFLASPADVTRERRFAQAVIDDMSVVSSTDGWDGG